MIKQRFSQWYCQYSGIIMSFGLVFMFLSGLRTYSIWTQILPSPFALLSALIASGLLTVIAYKTMDHLRLMIYKRLSPTFKTCSTIVQRHSK